MLSLMSPQLWCMLIREKPGRSKAIVRAGNESLDTLAREQSDAELVMKIKSGDKGAFGELLQRHQHAVSGIVSGIIRDRDDADDTVQDVFVQAYKHIGAFRCDCAFSTWIYRIAVNTSIKQTKKHKTRLTASIDDPLTGLSDTLTSPDSNRPDKLAERHAKSQALRSAVETLPEKHRVVVVLRYFRDFSCEDIARILDCSVGTVWSRLHYSCIKLQSQLGWFVGESEL